MTKTFKKHKTTLMAGLVLVLCVAVYFYRDEIKSFFSKGSSLSSAGTTVASTSTPSIMSPSTTTNTSDTNDTVLKKGSQGQKVKELQVLINKRLEAANMGFPKLVEDGIFGAKTESRLQLLIGKKSISINEFKKYK